MVIKGIMTDLDDTLYSFISIKNRALEETAALAVSLLGVDRVAFLEAYSRGREDVKRRMAGNQAALHSRLLYFQRALEMLGTNGLTGALELEECFWGCIIREMKAREGVLEFLIRARERGWKVGICSDMAAAVQHRKIRKLGLAAYIDALVTSEETGEEKPSALIFNRCLEKMGVEARQCLYIGDDMEKDVEGAKECGFIPVYFKEETGERILGQNGYLMTGSFKALAGYLENEAK